MRTGLSCKEIAEVLGVQPSKATQSADPAIRKVAGLLLAYPLKTWTELELAMRKLVREAEEDQIELECLRARGLADLPPTARARRRNGRPSDRAVTQRASTRPTQARRSSAADRWLSAAEAPISAVGKAEPARS